MMNKVFISILLLTVVSTCYGHRGGDRHHPVRVPVIVPIVPVVPVAPAIPAGCVWVGRGVLVCGVI